MKPTETPSPKLTLIHQVENDFPDPQAQIALFWSKLHCRTSRRVTSIFPASIHCSLVADDVCQPKPFYAAKSYELAAQQCYTQVQSIADQCGHSNTKFRDPDFDIESDFAAGRNNCLFDLVGSCDGNDSERGKDLPTEGHGLVQVTPGHSKSSDSDDHISIPGSVHRIPWIFRNPRFTISGYSASDVQQGASGDCWWLAALSTIAHRKDLMEKICVMRNEEVGVYGFVFHRDGEWISTVVDDYLYVTESDFDSEIYDATGRKARRHREQKQSGSDALLFAKCSNSNETWLPLLEKAFAKVHGDYQALNGGWSGMAIEDLTGGVTTVVASNSILYKQRLWSELLSSGVDGGDFVFALSSGPGETHRNGIVLSHAYSVLEAVEMRKEHGGVSRMLKIRNPWGQRSDSGYGEWHGAWADGSKEWNTYTMDALHHEFGDNGIFWMTYEDVVENFKYIYRTRLFDRGWSMAQKWTSIAVPWLPGFLKKRFIVDIEKKGTVVIVLSQLDERYFPGLQGEYDFTLHFLLRSTTVKTEICRVSPCHPGARRSINCELLLEPGIYEVIPKIIAERNELPSIEQMVKLAASKNPRKLLQIGLQYDLSHAKEGVSDGGKSVTHDPKQQQERVELEMRGEFNQGEGRSLHNDEMDPPRFATNNGNEVEANRKTGGEEEMHELKRHLAGDSEPGPTNDPNDKNENVGSKPCQDKNLDHSWGPVCAISLRVYAQHPNFTVCII